MRKSALKLILLLSLTGLGGCAALSPVQVGQTAGTIAGAAAVPGLGAPIGAIMGSLLGSIFQKKMDAATEQRERVELADQLESGSDGGAAGALAALPRGEPVRVWVDETVQEGQLLAGHFETRYLE